MPPQSKAGNRLHHTAVLALYAVVGMVFTWPLPLHMSTHVTGPPTGDTGVYLWNIWVFQHELLARHQFPLFTSAILSLDPRIDLALHNYTVFSNLLALPLIRGFGVVATFNIVYIALTVLCAFTCYLLARAVGGRRPEAFLGGLVFAWSPALVARGTAHFSLVAAAPLPIFALCLLMAERTGARKFMIAAGLTLAWAAYCDPYYAVYCALLALLHVLARSISWAPAPVDGVDPLARARVATGIGIGLSAAVTLVILLTGGGTFRLGGVTVSATGLYTPVLFLTALTGAHVLVRLWPGLGWRVSPTTWRLVRLSPYGIVACGAALAPVLFAMLVRISEGRYVDARVFWRTSTPGVDLLAFFLPNPNHPLAPDAVRTWITSLDGGFVENVASIPWVVVAVIGLAMVQRRSVLSRYWCGLTLVFASLALGPFVRLAGTNTHIPTPWSVLRYVPLLGTARAPARFTALVMMAVAILFVLALASLSRARATRRRTILAVVSVALVAELWPAPRDLFSAAVPGFYDQIAADSRDVRVLELPFGIRDGLSSTGDFNASSQFYQTRHGKPIIGGYLSRVSAQRIEQNIRRPVLHALILLSQGETVPPELEEAATRRAATFASNARLGYVVIDHSRASKELVAFARRVLNLENIGAEDGRSLYRVSLAGRLADTRAHTAPGR
jgi:hypothetical protein